MFFSSQAYESKQQVDTLTNDLKHMNAINKVNDSSYLGRLVILETVGDRKWLSSIILALSIKKNEVLFDQFSSPSFFQEMK